MVAGPSDPSQGAARREGFLLIAFAVLALFGLWTVAVSELESDDPATTPQQKVSAHTDTPEPATP